MVAVALSVLTGLAVLAGLFIYLRYVRYERVAALHVPADTAVALRIDVEQVLFFEPVRKNLLPVANTLAAKPNPRSRLKRIQGRTGLELGVDLREIVIALGPQANEWVIALGGMFSKKNVVAAVAEVLNEDGLACQSEAAVATCASGLALGQASDGVLLLASNVARLRAAFDEQGTYAELGLDRDGPGGFALRGASIGALAAGVTLPEAEWANVVDRITGKFELGTPVLLDVSVELRGGVSAPVVEPSIESLLAAWFGHSSVPLEATGPTRLRGRLEWSRDQLDLATARLAQLMRGWAR